MAVENAGLATGKPSEAPRVSIVIPTHNRAGLVRRALESALRQTWTEFEVVVVDDGSEDGTAGLLAEYAARDPRVRVFTHPQARGGSAARNTGIRAARGEFIAGLDDDDEFLPERLQECLRHYDDDFSFLCTGYYVQGRRRKRVRSPLERVTLKEMLTTNVVGGQVFARRERFLELGGFDEQLPAAQDSDMWVRFLVRYGPARRIVTPLYVAYAVHDRRVTSSAKKFRGYFIYYSKHKRLMSPAQRRYWMYRMKEMRGARRSPGEFCAWVPPGMRRREIRKLAARLVRRLRG